jgi:hypothetical protein
LDDDTIPLATLGRLAMRFPGITGEEITSILEGNRYYALDRSGEPTQVVLAERGRGFDYADAEELILDDEWACEMLGNVDERFTAAANALGDARYNFGLALKAALSGNPVRSVLTTPPENFAN